MTTGVVLTVAVPTIPGRESLLSRCLWSIQTQAPGSNVEVMVVPGVGKLGEKANRAAGVASGEWFTVVDDDDWLDGIYLSATVPLLLAGDPDFLGFRVANTVNHKWLRSTITRGDTAVFGRTDHGPTPKGITRTSIWRRVPMGDHYTADRDWCAAVAPLIATHAFVDRHLYRYDYHDDTSWTGARDVGMWPVDWDQVRTI